MYPQVEINARDSKWLGERAILAPLNSMVSTINNRMVRDFPGELLNYSSVDSDMSEDEAIYFPAEFLNSLEVSGLPTHNLNLKVGIPIIILHSLVHTALLPDSSQMLCRLTSCMAHQRGKQFYSLGYLLFHLTHHYLSVSRECSLPFNHVLP